jgi:hypothetical protein
MLELDDIRLRYAYSHALKAKVSRQRLAHA